MTENKETNLFWANEFTCRRHNLSKMQMNALYFIIEQVRSVYKSGMALNEKGEWKNMTVKLPSNRLSKIADKNHTAEARKALTELVDLPLDIEDGSGDWLHCHYINYVKKRHSDDFYEVEVSRELMPYLVELTQKYTSLQLSVLLTLTSKYSKSFYEFCCKWRNFAKDTEGYIPLMSLKRLRQILLLEDKYTQNQDFNRKVLDVASKELKKIYDKGECDIYFTYEQEGKGKDAMYRFRVINRDFEAKPTSASSSKVTHEYREQCLAYIFNRSRDILPNDPKFSNRLLVHMNENPDDILRIYEKLTLKEKAYKFSDLPKIWRHLLRNDFNIE